MNIDKSAQAAMDGFKTFVNAVVDFYVEVFKAIVTILKPILTVVEQYLMQHRKPIKWRKLNKRR